MTNKEYLASVGTDKVARILVGILKSIDRSVKLGLNSDDAAANIFYEGLKKWLNQEYELEPALCPFHCSGCSRHVNFRIQADNYWGLSFIGSDRTRCYINSMYEYRPTSLTKIGAIAEWNRSVLGSEPIAEPGRNYHEN